jgi:hypothetical protein
MTNSIVFGTIHQHSDAPQAIRLLPLCHHWPHSRATKRRYKFPPPHLASPAPLRAVQP